MGVDLGELPRDILESISKRLTIYSDYLRFRAVCRNWHSSIPKTPLHLPPQLPWLMLSQSTFFHLSNHQTHILTNLPLPHPPSRYCGSSHGCLILLNQTPLIRLLNPLTRATCHLPPLHTFPNVVAFSYANVGREYLVSNSRGGIDVFDLRQMCDSFVRKVVLSSSPSLSDDFSAVAIVGEGNLAFCRNGDCSWVMISEELYCWEDVVHHNGVFYAVSKEGVIAVCDVNVNVKGSCSPQVSFIHTTPLGFVGDIHYAVFSGDEFLLVTRILEQEFGDEAADYSNLVYRTVGFQVFKMDWGTMTWQKIETLGDRVLFIGGNSSLSFSASEFVGCLGDCIYYTDDYSESNYDDAYGKHDLGIFSLRDQSIEPLPCYPRDSYSRLGWPLPIWLSPNPC